MSIVIDTKLTVPVTEEQSEAFARWAKSLYGNYREYNEALKSTTRIDEFIRANLLPTEMKQVWDESELYVRSRSNEPHVKECKLYRQRINKKVSYMKVKLGEYAYRYEVRAYRQEEQQKIRQQLRARRINILMHVHGLEEELYNRLVNDPGLTEANMHEYIERVRNSPLKKYNVSYNKKEISEEYANTWMKDDCCICMDKHTMNSIIEGPCGHQIGKYCFQEWSKKAKGHVNCPLCRGECDTVSELVCT
jgi:hypothetical protein